MSARVLVGWVLCTLPAVAFAQAPEAAQPRTTETAASPDPIAAPPAPAAPPADPVPGDLLPAQGPAPTEATREGSASQGERAAPFVRASGGASEATIVVGPEGCREWIAPGMPEGPVVLGFNEADVATGRRTCPRTELSIGERLGATIDTADFYGQIAATTLVSGSFAQAPNRELFFTLEALHYGWAVNAVIQSTDLGFGQLTVGASQVVASGASWATATSARLMLPTSMLSSVRVVGAEIGQAVTFRPTSNFEFHGYVGVDGSAAVFVRPQPLGGVLVNAGLQFSPFTRASIVLDVNGRFGGFSSYLAPSIALRFRIVERIGLEIAGTRPLFGTDRRTAIAGLRLSYRM